MGGATHGRGYHATILVVDDEASLRGLMVRTLTDVGYRILARKTGWSLRRRTSPTVTGMPAAAPG